jgi:hypothetical protein
MHRRSALLATVTLFLSLQAAAGVEGFHDVAHEYYQWRDAAYPVATSAAGDHRFDSRLTDYSMTEKCCDAVST